MTQEEFEKIVAEAINEFPEVFLQKLKNVAIVVAKEPTEKQKRELELGNSWSLFGLYEGIPQSERENNYSLVLPDKITIFQDAAEEESKETGEDIKKIVSETIWHEIAHHFGMDEGEVEKAEQKRKK